MQKKISFFSLVLLIIAGIDSIRTLPTTAFFGSSLIFYFLISSIIFLIPIALISAEFSSRYPEQGGIFHWVRHAFGDKTGVLAVWLQWINTMVWYPTMLLFIAGTAAHLVNPQLAENKFFLISGILAIFWGLTFINLKGIQVSARLSSFCATIGTLLPMAFLTGLGILWIITGKPLAISFSWNDLIPTLGDSKNYGIIVTIMASFLGMELAGVHVSDIHNPQKNFPKAVGCSVFILLGTLIFSSLSVAVVIPSSEIHFVDGVMQTFTTFFNAFHMDYLVPVLACLIIIGSIGGSVNWLLSPAKGLLQMGEYGFLPSFLIKKNKHNVPVRILILQAFLVSCFCFLIELMPSVNSYYWFLMALSTALYMLMYILLLVSALKLGRPQKESLAYRIPTGIRTISCLLGLFGCLITIIIGFQPTTPDVMASNKLGYAGFVAIGFLLMLAPVPFLYFYQKKQKNLSVAKP
jgi:amino acid transporter